MINYILGLALMFFLGFKAAKSKKHFSGKRYLQKMNHDIFRKAHHNSVIGNKPWNIRAKNLEPTLQGLGNCFSLKGKK